VRGAGAPREPSGPDGRVARGLTQALRAPFTI
jgi:hypothetical protein